MAKVMNTYLDKTQENKSRSVATAVTKKQSDGESTFQFLDNRPEVIQTQKLQVMANDIPQVKQLRAFHAMANTAQLHVTRNNYSTHQQQPIQKKETNTGLTHNLKSGLKNQWDVIQPKMVGAYDVTFTPGYASWEQDDVSWHINWSLGEEGVYHVTDESTNPKTHYFFTLSAGVIKDAVAPKGMKGRKGTSKKFSALPRAVKDYISANIGNLQSE